MTGTTELIGAFPAALATGDPLDAARAGAGARRRSGFKIAAVPFHMWVPDTYEAGSDAVCRVARRSRRRPRASSSSSGCISRAPARPALVWMPVVVGVAGLTIVAGNLMAIPQQNVKRLLAYSGIAHIGYMLIGVAAMSANGAGMVLFYLVAYLFGNMGAFLVVQAVARSEGSDDDGRLPRPRAALAGARAEHAGLPAVARRHPVRRRLLGEAVHLPRGDRSRHMYGAGVPRRGPHRSSRSTTTSSSPAGCTSTRRCGQAAFRYQRSSVSRSSSASSVSSASGHGPAPG